MTTHLQPAPPARTFAAHANIESTGPAEVRPAFKAVEKLTVTSVFNLCEGTTPSVGWEWRHGPDASDRSAGTLIASGTETSVTTGTTTPVASVVVPAGDIVWFRTTSQTGIVFAHLSTISGILG
jgi:hypothetical protein